MRWPPRAIKHALAQTQVQRSLRNIAIVLKLLIKLPGPSSSSPPFLSWRDSRDALAEPSTRSLRALFSTRHAQHALRVYSHE
eukprot:2948759-Pleurochrysis_carterae.AAC.2